MRARFLSIAIASVLCAIAAASCGQGGTGVGTAPPPPGACPAAGLPSGRCEILQVCAYPLCSVGATCAQTDIVAFCPGPGGTWTITTRGDGGTFTDAVIPEISTDANTDADANADANTDADASADGDALEDSAETADADESGG